MTSVYQPCSNNIINNPHEDDKPTVSPAAYGLLSESFTDRNLLWYLLLVAVVPYFLDHVGIPNVNICKMKNPKSFHCSECAPLLQHDTRAWHVYNLQSKSQLSPVPNVQGRRINSPFFSCFKTHHQRSCNHHKCALSNLLPFPRSPAIRAGNFSRVSRLETEAAAALGTHSPCLPDSP